MSTTLGTSIDSSEIVDGSVGTADLADNGVSAAKLADGSVTAAKVADGAIVANKLAANAITSSALAGGSVTFAKLNQGGCTDGQTIKWNDTASSWQCASDNTGTPTTYSAGTGLTMTSNTISLDFSRANSWSGLQSFSSGVNVGGNTYTNLAGSGLSVASGVLASTLGTSIDSSEIVDGTISTADFADGSVTGPKLADNSITSAKIADGTIVAADLANGAVTSGSIADGAITAAKLSTASRKRVVSANVGSIAIGILSTQEQAVFVAPTNGTITKVSFTSGNSFASVTSGGTISVERKTATTATVASMNLSSIGMTALTPVAPTLGGGTSFNAGDVYTFKYAPGIVGLTLNNLLVSIEYIANE